MLTNILIERTYDDNVFLTKENKKGGQITNTIPSISLVKEKDKLYLNLQYVAHLTRYNGYSEENKDSQRSTWDMGIRPGAKSKIGIRGVDTYDYIKFDERESALASNTTKLNSFSVTPYIEKKIGKRLKILLNYTHSERAYIQNSENRLEDSENQLEGSENQKGNADFYYMLSKRVSIEWGYRYYRTNFTEETPDYSEQEVNGGLALELMKSKVRMTARVGHVWEEDELDQKDEYDSIDAKVDISLLKDTSITTGYTRSSSYLSTHDTSNNFAISHTASLNIKHNLFHQKVITSYGVVYNFLDFASPDRLDKSYRGTARIDWDLYRSILLSLTGDWGISHYTYYSTDRRDRSSGGGAGLTWKIFKSVTLALNGKYTKSKYEPEARYDELYDGSWNLSYEISRNAFLEIGHQYLENRSVYNKLKQQDFEDEGYVNNKYNLGLKIVF